MAGISLKNQYLRDYYFFAMKFKNRTRLILMLAALLSLGLIAPHVFGSAQPEIIIENRNSELNLPDHEIIRLQP
jgi:hypothetical protein